MKNMKKIVAALMAMVMCVSFTACNKNTEGDTSTVENTSSEDSMDSENTVAEESSVEDSNSENDEDVLFPISDKIKNASLSDGYIQIGDDVFRNGGYMTFGEFVAEYSTENGGNWDVPGLMELLNKELNYEVSEEELSYCPYEWRVHDEKNNINMLLYCTEPVAGTGTVSDLVIVMFEYDVNSYNPETQDKYVKSEVLRVAGQTKNVESGDDVTAFYAEQGLKEAEAEYDDNFFCEENAGKYVKHTFEGNQDETIFGVVKGSEPNLYGYEPVFLYCGVKSLIISNIQYKDGCKV